jgi:hypothetical protein
VDDSDGFDLSRARDPDRYNAELRCITVHLRFILDMKTLLSGKTFRRALIAGHPA